MGITSSKWSRHDSKTTRVSAGIQTDTPKEVTQIPDVRSPTADIIRTPIIKENLKHETETPKEYRSPPLRKRLLKNLKLDPRSPTIGIYRTPILIEDLPSDSSSPNKFDSPVSTYSSNMSEFQVEDVMTPIEPSMNVSGFEFPKEIFCGEFDVTLADEEVKDTDESKSCLTVSDKPNTYEAKKLLEEIISEDENFIKKVKMSSRRGKKSHVKNQVKNVTETKGKFRPPLSNITSCTNSPSNINSVMKLQSRNKILPEFGAENSVSPNVKHVAQWDQNSTVVI